MNKLPIWVVPENFPMEYDIESTTSTEMVARLYGAMNTLIEDYNKFITMVNEVIEPLTSTTNYKFEEFAVGLRQEFQDFIDITNLKVKSQDNAIESAIVYIKDNIADGVQSVLEEMKNNGELSAEIMEAFNELSTSIANVTISLEEYKEVNNTNNNALRKHIDDSIANEKLEREQALLNESSERITSVSKLSAFHGKRIVAYGDSTITVLPSYISKITEYVECDVVNRGVGGTRMALGENNGASLIDSATDLHEYDIITISYGTNEWQANTSYDDIRGSVLTLISTIYSKNPNIDIVFCLPPYSFKNFNTGNIPNVNNCGMTLGDVCDFIKHYLTKHYKIRIVDFYSDSSCSPSNYASKLKDDSEGIFVHPNEQFADELCRILINGSSIPSYRKFYHNMLESYDFMEAQNNVRSLNYTPVGLSLYIAPNVEYKSTKKVFDTKNNYIIAGVCDRPFEITLNDKTVKINKEGYFYVVVENVTTSICPIIVKSTETTNIYTLSIVCESNTPIGSTNNNFNRKLIATPSPNITSSLPLKYWYDRNAIGFSVSAFKVSAPLPSGTTLFTFEEGFPFNQKFVPIYGSSNGLTFLCELTNGKLATVGNLAVGNYYMCDILIPFYLNERLS